MHTALGGNCQAPFGVWTERAPHEEGGIAGGMANFLPAAGGFLQALLHGYAGLRLVEEHGGDDGRNQQEEKKEGEAPVRLRVHPRCPPGVRRVRLRHLAFLGSHFALNYTCSSEEEEEEDRAMMTISLARSPPWGPRLVLVLAGGGGRLPLLPGKAVTVPAQEAFVVGEYDEAGGAGLRSPPEPEGLVAAAVVSAQGAKDCKYV